MAVWEAPVCGCKQHESVRLVLFCSSKEHPVMGRLLQANASELSSEMGYDGFGDEDGLTVVSSTTASSHSSDLLNYALSTTNYELISLLSQARELFDRTVYHRLIF